MVVFNNFAAGTTGITTADLEDKIVVKMSSICVDFVFKTSVLREFVFTNYCLNLPELSHLIKYNKEDLISS